MGPGGIVCCDGLLSYLQGLADGATSFLIHFTTCSVCGVTVSIVAFQAVDLGSIPGRRTIFYQFPQAFKTMFTLINFTFINVPEENPGGPRFNFEIPVHPFHPIQHLLSTVSGAGPGEI